MWKPGSVALVRKSTRVDARREVHLLDADLRAVAEEADGGRLGDGRADRDLDLDVLADARGGGRVDALDDHLVGRTEADDIRLDLDAARAGECGLGLAAAGRVVAVADEHDAFLGLVREERRRKAQRTADVGSAARGDRRETVEFGQLGWQALDQRLAAKGDDRRLVTLRPLLQ